MANTGDNNLTSVAGKILARAYNAALRGRNVVSSLVTTDLKPELVQKGATIEIEVAPTLTTQDVTPSNTPVAATGVTLSTLKLNIDRWRESTSFGLSNKQFEEVDASRVYFPPITGSAVAAVADYFNLDLMTEIKNASYTVVGTPGTTPMASNVSEIVNATKALDDAKADLDRNLILDTAAKANAALRDELRDAYRYGDRNTVQTGEVGSDQSKVLGFGWRYDQQVIYHTAGTITTGLVAKAATAQAIGLSAIVCTTAASTGACALKKGDIITFAGSAQTYVLTADATQASASTDVTLNISPPLVKALAGSEAVAVKASHRCNLAFPRNAVAVGMRMLDLGPIQKTGGAVSVPSLDPVSGLMFRLYGSGQYKQDVWNVDAAWGVLVNRPDHVVRIMG